MKSPILSTELAKEYSNGTSAKELAKKYNKPITKILSLLIGTRIIIRKEKFNFTKDEKMFLVKRFSKYGYDYDFIRDFLKIKLSDDDIYFTRTGRKLSKKKKRKASKYFEWREFINHPMCFHNRMSRKSL